MGMGFDMRKPTGFGENPALVVIDMNMGAVGEDMPVYEQFDRYPRTCGEYGWRALPYIQRLIDKARETTKIPIVYSRHVFRAGHGLARGTTIPDLPYSEAQPPVGDRSRRSAPRAGGADDRKDAGQRLLQHAPPVRADEQEGRHPDHRGQLDERLRPCDGRRTPPTTPPCSRSSWPRKRSSTGSSSPTRRACSTCNSSTRT